MAQCHTPLPKHEGERNLAKQLISFNDPHLHLWFGLDFIPGVEDIDILLWHERKGVFVIEVKAVPLKMIDSFGLRSCTIRGRPPSKGPQIQAYEAHESLRRFLSQRLDKPLRISSTACWPCISREAWNNYWDSGEVVGEYAKRMIFQEDIYADAETFAARLEHIWYHPPVRSGASWPFRHQQDQFDKLQQILNFESRPKPAPSELKKLKEIERRVVDEVQAEVPAADNIYVLYRGLPGTGKTFRLLEIGIRHAIEGRQVLFVLIRR